MSSLYPLTLSFNHCLLLYAMSLYEKGNGSRQLRIELVVIRRLGKAVIGEVVDEIHVVNQRQEV